MKKRRIAYLIIILLGILIGVVSGFADFSLSFIITIVMIIIGILSLFVAFIGIVKKNQLSSYGVVALLSVIIFFFSMKVTSKLLDNYRQNKVEKIISKIENYKKEKGKIPINLKTINSQNELENLEYNPQIKTNHFTIGYPIDGWNYKIYESKTGKWMIID